MLHGYDEHTHEPTDMPKLQRKPTHVKKRAAKAPAKPARRAKRRDPVHAASKRARPVKRRDKAYERTSAAKPTLERTLVALAGHKQAYEQIASEPDDREAWLAARRNLVTASDVPAILGLVPGKTRLWYEKAGLLPAQDLSGFEAVGIGRELEHAVQRMYMERTQRVTFAHQKLLRSRKYPWLGCTMDARAYLPGDDMAYDRNPGPLELKTTGNGDKWDEELGPCEPWVVQLQTQMLVTGWTWGSLAALLGSPYMHFRWVDFHADPAMHERIVTETRAFVESIQKLEPPTDDASDDTTDAMKRLALEALAGDSRILPDESCEWALEMERAREGRLAWEHRERYYRNLLVAAIGWHQRGILPDGSGSYTMLPEFRKGYTVADSTSRVLRKVQPV